MLASTCKQRGERGVLVLVRRVGAGAVLGRGRAVLGLALHHPAQGAACLCLGRVRDVLAGVGADPVDERRVVRGGAALDVQINPARHRNRLKLALASPANVK